MRVIGLGLCGVLLAIGVPSTSGVAVAAPRACVYSDSVGIYNGHATGFKVGRDAFDKIYGTRGITLTITAGRSTGVATTLTGSATAGVSFVVAKADATTSLALAVSQSTTTTAGGTWTVPSSQASGWLAFGTFSTYSYTWKETVREENCTTVQHSGTGVSPVTGQHYGYTHS